MVLTLSTDGQRLDAALAEAMPELSRSAAQRLIDQGCVLLNGRPAGKSDRTKPGDKLDITLPQVQSVPLSAQDIPLSIAYEDADVIVIDKPKGLVVHPAPGHPDGTLVNALLHHCGDSLSGIGGEKRPGIVHRIDKDTSGLLIAAKNDFAHQALSDQLADHSLHRVYYAVLRGSLRDDSGTVSAPIGRHPTDRKRMAVVADGRPAVTHYRVLCRYAGYTYVQLQLETGRTHQIRVHMAYLQHPVLGDQVYGLHRPELGQSSQCLHAGELMFVHPRTGRSVAVSAPLPDYFLDVLRRLDGRRR